MEQQLQSTQLADSHPQFDAPIRVAIPVNAPPRAERVLHDHLLGRNAFSPSAILASTLTMKSDGDEDLALSLASRAPSIKMDHDAHIKTAISDFTAVAFASRRNGKKDVEAMACVSLGVIYDNQGNFIKAIEQYEQYSTLAEEVNDTVGLACAYNCLGVNYMLLAVPASDSGILFSAVKSPHAPEYLSKAVYYHQKHLALGPDSGAHFVSNSNLGTSIHRFAHSVCVYIYVCVGIIVNNYLH